MKTFLCLAGMIMLAGCTGAPPIVPGKGAIYGTVSADSHKAIVKKAATRGDPDYRSEEGMVLYDKHMVNYHNLKELYVCLIDPHYPGTIGGAPVHPASMIIPARQRNVFKGLISSQW